MGAKRNPPPILRDEVLERLGGDADFLDELLELYRKELTAKRKAVGKALAKRDKHALRELGHGLKGASASLSLPGMSEAAFALETAGREGDIDAARTALEKLDAEFARLEAFLR
jgi:two-component system sensor histidine kinase/response regulator